MPEQADPGFDMLAEIQLPTPLYRATREVAPGDLPMTDALGHVYDAGLLWPTIQRALSHDFYGIRGAGTVTLQLTARHAAAEPAGLDQPTPANPDAAVFRAVEARGATVILRRLNRATGALVHRFTGTIQQVEFTSGGLIQLTLADTLPDIMATPYPRVRITADDWPTATSEALSLGATVPLHLGQHREHTPCRHVEATERVYAHGTAAPRLFTRHRYVVAGALARAAGGDANVLPTIRSLYRGMPIGAALIPPGEYTVAINRTLEPPANLTATLAPGGSLLAGTGALPMRVYQVTALHGCGESRGSNLAIITISAANVTANQRSVRLDWVPVEGATGYAVSVTVGGLGMLLAIVPGGDAAAFIDTGAYTGLAPYAPPAADTTGQATVEVCFRQAQLGVDSALAPILADVATTRRAWDGATCRSVWHLDHDTRDERPARQNPLVRGTTVSLWLFERTGLDHVGTNHLAMTGLRPDDYVMGPHQKPAWLANGVGYGITHTTTGMDFGTGSFQFECEVRTDVDTLERLCILCEKWGSQAAVTFRQWNGKAYAAVWDGTVVDGAPVMHQVAGTLRLDGARHRLRMVVNRATNVLAVYVDDQLEDSVSLAGVGSLTNDGPFTVGTSSFTPGLADAMLFGELNWLRYDTDPAPFLPAGDRYDGTHADQRVLMLPHAACRDLDIGSATGWTIEARIRVTQLAPDTAFRGLAGKANLANQVGAFLGLAGTGPLTPWRVAAIAGYQGGAVTRSIAGGSLDLGTHDVALTYQAPTPTTDGALLAIANGAIVASATFPAGAVPTIAPAVPFLLGGTHATDPDARTPVEILEVRVTARTRTLAELAEAHYLAERNPVRQVRSLLVSGAHGPGLVLDAASWDAAEVALAGVADGQLQTDYAMVEPLPLQTHLAELLRVRGIRLALTEAGLLGCTIDQPRAVVASFGRKDGYWENLPSRPTWTQTPLAEAYRQCRVRFRRKRATDGAIDRFVLTTSPRTVHPVGRDTPELFDLPAIRELVAGDLVGGYLGARLALQDTGVSFASRDDEALDVVPGDRVTLYDSLSGRPETDLEIRQVDESGSVKDGSLFQFRAAPWADVYAYVPGTLPPEPDRETRPDYSATYPPKLADFDVVFAVTVGNDGRRIWTATASWSRPESENLQTLVVAWRVAGTTAWQTMGVGLAVTTAVLEDRFDDATTYEFRLTGHNRFGLVGAPSLVTRATTLPGAPAAPTGLAAKTSGAARQRWWDWNDNAERNLRGYLVEVYATNATSGGQPTGTRLQQKTVRGSSHRYSEGGLAAATQRWCRVQAVNQSGVGSAWTALVAATGTTVETDDVADGATSRSYASAESDLVTEQVLVPGGFVTVGNLPITPPSGEQAIPTGTESVRIGIDFTVRQIAWGDGGDTTGVVTARLLRGGATIGTREVLSATVPAAAGSVPDSRRPVHIEFVERAPAATSAATYALQIEYTRATANPPAKQHNIGIRTPKFHVTVQKR